MTSHQQPELNQLFAERLPAKLKQLARSLDLLAQKNWEKENVETFAALVTRLEQSCVSFHHVEAEKAVKQVSALLEQVIKFEMPPTEADIRDVMEGLSELSQAEMPSPLASNAFVADDGDEEDSETTEPEDESFDLTSMLRESVLYIYSEENSRIKTLGEQIGHFGFATQIFTDLDSLKAAMSDAAPAALAIYNAADTLDEATLTEIREAHKEGSKAPPVLVLSAVDELELRLQAVRTECYGFFPEPFQLSYIVERLEELNNFTPDIPYRLLIVEDSKAQAKLFAKTFSKAGIEVHLAHHPSELAQALIESEPELIIMDMMMPVCSGLELSHVIRQQEQYRHLPICFLSANNDAIEKLAVLTIAGEDFLPKSIRPEQLTEAILLRLKRARANAHRRISNNLTGLFNGATFLRHLNQEASRAQREKSSFVLALLNIDNLHAVNEEYGYGVGDHVIKSLANLLKQRLRLSDIVGHFNRSDFAIILTDCSIKNANKILSALSKDFASVAFNDGKSTFSLSFCYGLAKYVDNNIPALQNKAQNALANAKAKRGEVERLVKQ